MQARFITDRQQWNDFVAASEYGNITQSFEWGELAQHAGSVPLYLGVVDEQNVLQAAMLILMAQMPVLKTPYFYVPRGPVVADPAAPALTVLLNFAKSEARKRGAFMLKVDPQATVDEQNWNEELVQRGFRPASHASHVRNEWVLDIRPDEKELLSNMKEKWRYNIRLAGRKGVTIRRGESDEDVETFYHILQETSERDQFFIHDAEHLKLLFQLYDADRSALFLAEHEGKAIAGIIMMRFGCWSWYRYGASSAQSRNVMPNHLLQWTGMQWARGHGCWYYNFLGIPDSLEEEEAKKDPLWGVYSFKRGFGGFARCALSSYELAYNPLIYRLYTNMLGLKHWRDQRRQVKMERAKDQEQNVQSKIVQETTISRV